MDTTKLLKALQNSTNAYALEQEVLFLRLAAREIADLLDRIPEHQPAEEPATDEEASLCIFCGKDTWDGSRMICTDPECELSQPEEDTAGKDHLHCPQHGEPQPCNVCRAEDAEAEVADLKARLRLIRDCEADLDTLEGAEEKVLALAEQHHAYGAMIDKVREAWSASLEKRYGIKDGCWDVSRDLALAEVAAREKRHAKVREATRRIIIPIEDAICNLDKRCLHGEAHPLRAAVTALRAALEEDEDGTHSAV